MENVGVRTFAGLLVVVVILAVLMLLTVGPMIKVIPQSPGLSPEALAIQETNGILGHDPMIHGAAAISAVTACSVDPNGHLFKKVYENGNIRWGTVCFSTPDGKWGIVIKQETDGLLRDVTAFLKDNMSSWDDILHYMKSAGYSLIK